MRKGSVFAVGVGLGLAASILMGARNSSGTMSLVAGNPVVSGQTISSTWANNTMSDISTELTDSLSRSGKGAMLAPLECTDGTVSAPSLTFDNDTNTGLYRVGADNPGLTAGGVKVQEWFPTSSVFSKVAIFDGGAGTVQLKAGTQDHVYAEFYADSDDAGTRSGYIGYANAATHVLSLVNSMPTGDVSITTATGGKVTTDRNVELSGSNPIYSTGYTDTLTPINIPKAWGVVNVGATYELVTGFNVVTANCASSDITITIQNDLSSADYAVMLSKMDIAGGGTPPQFVPSVRDRAAGSFVIQGHDFTGASADLCAAGYNGEAVHFVVFGAQ